MPVVQGGKERDAAEGIRHRTPKQWVRHARKWLGAGSGFMRP
jgi:hypothetical protein